MSKNKKSDHPEKEKTENKTARKSDAKNRSTTNQPELKSIKSKLLARGASLLGVGMKSTAKAAGVAIEAAFSDKARRKELYDAFFLDRVKNLVSEMEQLKGGVMKAGQMLSVYGEHFLPDEINSVLKKLQSDSRPVSFEQMERVMVRSLGKELYGRIDLDPTPVGAASMGQVYRGRLDGKDLVFKVQYPGVAKSIDSDLKALRTLLSMSKIIPNMKQFDEIFAEVKTMLHKEADYARELKSLEKYRELIETIPSLSLPKGYPEYSGKRVICMDYVEGIRLDDERVKNLPLDRRNALGASLLTLLFHEIFDWQIVQTDPHIGNFLVQLKEDGFSDDKIVLLDFGAVRKLPNKYVDPFRRMALAAVNENGNDIVNVASEMGFIREDDPEKMKDLFTAIVLKATSPFQKKSEGSSLDGSSMEPHEWDWGDGSLVDELSAMGKDAIFSFKLRPPPREAVFVDRKLVGTATILKMLKVKFGPRKLALKFLEA